MIRRNKEKCCNFTVKYFQSVEGTQGGMRSVEKNDVEIKR